MSKSTAKLFERTTLRSTVLTSLLEAKKGFKVLKFREDGNKIGFLKYLVFFDFYLVPSPS